jgi:hypothetical protein
LEIQQTDALLRVRWIHQEMKELEIHEKSFQEDSLEVDSRQFHIVMRMHRLHLVNLKGIVPHRLLQECTIESLIEKGISQGVKREEIGSFHDEIWIQSQSGMEEVGTRTMIGAVEVVPLPLSGMMIMVSCSRLTESRQLILRPPKTSSITITIRPSG